MGRTRAREKKRDTRARAKASRVAKDLERGATIFRLRRARAGQRETQRVQAKAKTRKAKVMAMVGKTATGGRAADRRLR